MNASNEPRLPKGSMTMLRLSYHALRNAALMLVVLWTSLDIADAALNIGSKRALLAAINSIAAGQTSITGGTANCVVFSSTNSLIGCDGGLTKGVGGGVAITSAGTTTTTSSGALNNTTTGNITVGSTTGWPTPGTLRTNDGNTTELMSYTVVDGTTLNVTARGVYGSSAATHAGVVTLAYASYIDAASTSAVPWRAEWSNGSSQVPVNSTSSFSPAGMIFTGLNQNSGYGTSSSVPAVYLNGNEIAEFGTGQLKIATGGVSSYFTVPANGTWQLGQSDSASPAAQTLQAQSVSAGNANTAGATLTIAGSKSNGSGGGDIVIQTTNSSAGSGTQNTLATAMTIKGGTQTIQIPAVTTGTPAASLCIDASNNIIKKTTTGSCI